MNPILRQQSNNSCRHRLPMPKYAQALARRALFTRAVVAIIFAINAGMFQLPFYADFFQKQGQTLTICAG